MCVDVSRDYVLSFMRVETGKMFENYRFCREKKKKQTQQKTLGNVKLSMGRVIKVLEP